MTESSNASGADRKAMVATLVDLLMEANRRDIAALERQGWPGIPEVPVGDMEIHCGHLISALIKADLFRDDATIKAEALREAATAAREEAANSRTPQGRYEAEGMADWLDDRATEIDPARLEGAHP